MIIYGTRASHVSTEQLQHVSCPSCGTESSVSISLFSRYVHIFWIPLFPYGKKAVSQCQHCQQVLEERKMPKEFKDHLATQKMKSRTPIWQFIGLVIIAALAVWFYFVDKNNTQKELAFLADPQINDVYEFKTEGNYSTFKIVDFYNDSVVVSYNNYETNKMSGIYKIDKEENYTEEYFLLSKDEIKAMYEDGTVLDINRK